MIAIVTFTYPSSEKYFKNFVLNLKNQTYKNFELIIFNDGVNSNLENFNEFNPLLINVNGTPLQNRLIGLNELKKLNFNKYIFIDIDDFNSLNRIETLNNLLNSNLLVCNDLNLMNEDNEIIEKKYWGKRLPNLFEFDFNFLQKKNIVGFGNTGIRKEILELPIKESSYPIVADWFIFYQIIKNNQIKCLFTSECQTNYRQHSNNQIGLKDATEVRLNYVIDVVKNQYKALNEINCDNLELKKININKKTHLFWWEEIF